MMSKEIPLLLKKQSVTDMFETICANGGFKKGELCVLFAKTDCGKSKFSESIITEMQAKRNKNV